MCGGPIKATTSWDLSFVDNVSYLRQASIGKFHFVKFPDKFIGMHLHHNRLFILK